MCTQKLCSLWRDTVLDYCTRLPRSTMVPPRLRRIIVKCYETEGAAFDIIAYIRERDKDQGAVV